MLNFSVARSNDWEADFATNVEGAAQLMARYEGIDGFFQCSTAGVYESQGHTLLTEAAPLGDSHRAAGMATYSISKIAAEALVQHTARRLGIPTVIARLSVPYGDTFGWPMFQLMMIEHGMAMAVSPDPPTTYSPLHLDDIVASLPYLLDAASVPATIVNWGGDEVVGVEAWTTLIGEMIGKDVVFEPSEQRHPVDPARRVAPQRPRLPLERRVAGRHPAAGRDLATGARRSAPGVASEPFPRLPRA